MSAKTITVLGFEMWLASANASENKRVISSTMASKCEAQLTLF